MGIMGTNQFTKSEVENDINKKHVFLSLIYNNREAMSIPLLVYITEGVIH